MGAFFFSDGQALKRNWRLSSKIQPSPNVGELKPDMPKEVPKVY